jgi:GntR family transcriptional repressor for pyruvate dehydrogenase complex
MVECLFSQVNPRRGARLYELVAEQIEEMILSGQIQTGDRLPSESELGSQFSVSRTVVREAIKVLTDKGMVRPEPGRGTFVDRPDSALLVTSMDTIIRVEQCSLGELLELRKMIEIPAAGIAAERANLAQKEKIACMASVLEQDGMSVRQFLLSDKALHVAVARATGNELVAVMVGALMELCWKLQLVPVQTYPNSRHYHNAIAGAILNGDRMAAEQAMSAHHQQISQDLAPYTGW